MIIFPKKIRGREDRLSITIPKEICEQYSLEPGDFVVVTLENRPSDPVFKVQFRKRIAKCGSEGRLVYIPKKITAKHNLKRDMTVLVSLEEF